MLTLPFRLPGRNVFTGVPGTQMPDQDTGGYDVLIDGHGFRLATSPDNKYERGLDETTTRRFDSSLEVGEQSLSPLPWKKSQSSFHAGAGQRNLEVGYTSFEYQQEKVEHIRYWQSLGVDPWDPGVVRRLPDTVHTEADLQGGGIPHMIAAAVNGVDYVIAGGAGLLKQVAWSSGPDAPPVVSDIDLTGVDFGGSASNVTVRGMATDGTRWFASCSFGTPVAGKTAAVISGSVTSLAAPTVRYDAAATGPVGWEKARLVAALGSKVYELDPLATAHSALPTAKYTHPSSSFSFSCTASSPKGILLGGAAGGKSAILELTLDSSGGTPTLTGGSTAAELPDGEVVSSMATVVGTILAVGTSDGVRIGTFDTFSGDLKLGPVSLDAPNDTIRGLATRDRFVYATMTNGQADGSTGLHRVDTTMVVDSAGRSAYAGDLRPAPSDNVSTGICWEVFRLPGSGRMCFYTDEGLFVEGPGPGSDGPAWLTTSRIRYSTAELKLFKLGRIHGTLDVAEIGVTGIVPFDSDVNLGTYGFLTNSDDTGEFRLVDGLHEWMQLKFSLNGAACELNSYHVKAYPAPRPQMLVTMTLLCFVEETDRYGLTVVDPEQPRARYEHIRDLARDGREVRLVEFTNIGSAAEQVVIDQFVFRAEDPPNVTSDFGGYITIRLRTTES